MSNTNGASCRGLRPLPYEVTGLYPGKHIIFSEDEQRVIGAGDTPEEAQGQAIRSGVKGTWHFGFSALPDVDQVF
jgi:hypothetical protein